MSKLSKRDISVTLLWLLSYILVLVVLVEIFGKIHSLLEPLVAAPSHSNLIKIFKQRNESNEIGILQ